MKLVTTSEKDIEELADVLGKAIGRNVGSWRWHQFIGIVIDSIAKEYENNLLLGEPHWDNFIKYLTHTVNDYA